MNRKKKEKENEKSIVWQKKKKNENKDLKTMALENLEQNDNESFVGSLMNRICID